jgi:hypothetical protein
VVLSSGKASLKLDMFSDQGLGFIFRIGVVLGFGLTGGEVMIPWLRSSLIFLLFVLIKRFRLTRLSRLLI